VSKIFNMGTLYIIGNGFDLKHNIPSRYSDFAKFVMKNNYELFQQVERCLLNLSPNNSLWCNFEDALGTQNLSELLKDVKRNGKIKRDYPIGINDVDLKESMKEWILSLKQYISICSLVEKKYYFESNACFLSFNYTNTLEELYKIDKNRICHIHGYVDDKEKQESEMFVGYIFGHGFSSVNIDLDKCDEYEAQELNETINSYAKEIQKEKLERFVSKLHDISDIVVLGHSLGLVDKPYFEIFNKDFANINWQIGYYDNNDLCRKIYNCRKIGIDSSNIVFFQDN